MCASFRRWFWRRVLICVRASQNKIWDDAYNMLLQGRQWQQKVPFANERPVHNIISIQHAVHISVSRVHVSLGRIMRRFLRQQPTKRTRYYMGAGTLSKHLGRKLICMYLARVKTQKVPACCLGWHFITFNMQFQFDKLIYFFQNFIQLYFFL